MRWWWNMMLWYDGVDAPLEPTPKANTYCYKPCLTCIEMVLPRRSLASMMHDSYMNCTIVLFIHLCLHVFNIVVLWQCITLCMSHESYEKLTCCSPSIRAVAHIYNLYIPLLICLPLLKGPHLAFGVLLGSLWHGGVPRMSFASTRRSAPVPKDHNGCRSWRKRAGHK